MFAALVLVGWSYLEQYPRKSTENKELPNIVFFISDDLSASDISLYNSKGVNVKNIVKLAAEGITFNRAFVASPSCAPSRGALLTGLYPARNGAMANHTYPREEILKLPNLLREIGYEVISFGKVGHGFEEQKAKDYGFDHFSKESVNLPKQVRNFFKNRRNTKPICLLMGDRRPHVPWIKDSNYPMDSVSLPTFLLNSQETDEHWARYATDIQGMDKDLGEILTLTKDMFGDDYIFLFSSDHGSQWPFGKWNLYDYGSHVPLVVSWPNKIKRPRQTNAMVSWVDIFPTLIDLTGGKLPDNLDGKSFLKVLQNPEANHRDFIYTTHSGDGHFNVYPMRSVRTDRFKYIHNLFSEYYHTNHSDILRKNGAGAYWDSWEQLAVNDSAAKAIIDKYHMRPEFEFFDLINDPLEQHNLAGNPKYGKDQEELKKLLAKMNVQQNDSLLLIGIPYPRTEDLPTQEAIQNRLEARKKDQ
jgi:arylsulfatase A-like enzyme